MRGGVLDLKYRSSGNASRVRFEHRFLFLSTSRHKTELTELTAKAREADLAEKARARET